MNQLIVYWIEYTAGNDVLSAPNAKEKLKLFWPIEIESREVVQKSYRSV